MSAEPVPEEDPILERPESIVLDRRDPWTEADYFALPGGSTQRTELLDGSLLMSPLGDLEHQRLASRLYRDLDAGLPGGLEPFAGANVRLATDRIVIPDVVVAHEGADGLALEADAVLLLAEVVSPSSKMIDRLVKPQVYAAAGIPWYLRVERHDGLELTLHQRRDEEAYEVAAKAGEGESLALPEFGCSLEVDALNRRRA